MYMETEGIWLFSCISHFYSRPQGITSVATLFPMPPHFPAPWKCVFPSESSHGPEHRAKSPEAWHIATALSQGAWSVSARHSLPWFLKESLGFRGSVSLG